MTFQEVLNNLHCIIWAVEVSDHPQKLCQFVVGLDAREFRVSLQQSFPEFFPIEFIILETGLGEFEEAMFNAIALPEEVEIMDVPFDKDCM